MVLLERAVRKRMWWDGQANDSIWRELPQQDVQAGRRLMEQLKQFCQ
jgi:hypothetical protein